MMSFHKMMISLVAVGLISDVNAFHSSQQAVSVIRSGNTARRLPVSLRTCQQVGRCTMSAPVTRSNVLAAAAAAGALTLSQSANAAEAPMWAYSDLLEAVDGNRVEKATFSQDGKRVLSVDTDGQLHDTEILPTAANTLLAKLNAKGVRYTVQAPAQDSGNMALGVLSNLLPPVLLLGGLFLLNRRGAGGGAGGGMNPMNMGQSQSKIQMEPNTGVDFQDV